MKDGAASTVRAMFEWWRHMQNTTSRNRPSRQGYNGKACKRFILTGAPGAGKTAIIRQLELDGFSVVEEAATDIIALEQARGLAEPWKHPSFKTCATAARPRSGTQKHDRFTYCRR